MWRRLFVVATSISLAAAVICLVWAIRRPIEKLPKRLGELQVFENPEAVWLFVSIVEPERRSFLASPTVVAPTVGAKVFAINQQGAVREWNVKTGEILGSLFNSNVGFQFVFEGKVFVATDSQNEPGVILYRLDDGGLTQMDKNSSERVLRELGADEAGQAISLQTLENVLRKHAWIRVGSDNFFSFPSSTSMESKLHGLSINAVRAKGANQLTAESKNWRKTLLTVKE